MAEETGRALHVVRLLQDPVFLHVEAVFSPAIHTVSACLSFSAHGALMKLVVGARKGKKARWNLKNLVLLHVFANVPISACFSIEIHR